jgi:hypothetical protein
MNFPTMKTQQHSIRIIDVDSPFMFGLGRDMTGKERKEAEKHGRFDNPPMSVLGVTHEGLAAVADKELAHLFAAAPEMLEALKEAEAAFELTIPLIPKKLDWSGSSARKGLAIVKSAIALAAGEEVSE